MNFAGFPPTIDQGSTLLNTHALAPTTAPFPIVTPIPTKTSAPTPPNKKPNIDHSKGGEYVDYEEVE